MKEIERALMALTDALSGFEEIKDETAYQRLISKTITFSAEVAKAGKSIFSEQSFTVIAGEGEPTFRQKGNAFEIAFPSVLKKSRRLTTGEDLAHLYEKYEKPIEEYFWDRDIVYGEPRVFWFSFHGCKGDCDNLETKVIIDLISGYFVPDDSGEYVSIYVTSLPDKEVKTVLKILTRDEFIKELNHETSV